jgi:hypothetical protein
MSYRLGSLPPSWSATQVRALAGLFLVTAVGAATGCADSSSINSPASSPDAPAITAPSGSTAAFSAASIFSGYNPAASAHFAHIRTQVTDYRIPYLAAGARAAEYTWTAQHYDRIVLDGGDATSMPEYRRLNPTAEIYRYALNWTVIQPTSASPADIATTYYPDMQAWYAANSQYTLESAFLHRTGCGATPACRVSFKIWNDDRWAINPGDAGLRAYQRQRLARVAADADGLFIDEHGSGDFDQLPSTMLLEYPDFAAYQRDVVSLLADERAGVGAGKRLSINSATYITSWDGDMVRAAGGVQGEYFNDPFFAEMEKRWSFAESAMASGASMSYPVGGTMPASYTAGGYASTADRRHVWELASYYLVEPAQLGLLYFNSTGSVWNQPFASSWLTAAEANVGLPTSARRIQAEGTDGSGRAYRVWARDLDNALVLVRPIISWSPQSYGDETAVNVALPTTNDFRVLHSDGTLGPVVTTVALRASEAAILIKSTRSDNSAPIVTTPTPAPPGASPVLAVIDQDAMTSSVAPNFFTRSDINADIAAVGQRKELRYFAANTGRSITLYTGKMGGYEGVYAPRTVPAAWAGAGPTTDGLSNYFRGGPGLGAPDALGSRESLLMNVDGAVPLRATGLKMLVGKTVCAVFVQKNTWVTSFAPIGVAFQGPNLGVAAFRVDAVTSFSGSTTARDLPKLSVTILSAVTACNGALTTLATAPAPTSPNLPFDVMP